MSKRRRKKRGNVSEYRQRPSGSQPQHESKQDEMNWRITVWQLFATVIFLILEVYFRWSASHLFATIVATIIVAGSASLVLPRRYKMPVCIFAILIGLIVLKYSPPNETKIHGWLKPAHNSTPPNSCNVAPESPIILLGHNVIWGMNTRKSTSLNVGDCTVLTIEYSAQGLAISGDIFAPDGKIVARLTRNEFHLFGPEVFYMERSDRSTLSVQGSNGKEALYIRYLNSRAIDIRGHFYCSDALLGIESDGSVISKGRSMACQVNDNCIGSVRVMMQFDPNRCAIAGN